MFRFPADRPWAPLLLKLTVESFLISKWEPLEPLPVLLITFRVLSSTVTTKVPVMPERLWSEV